MDTMPKLEKYEVKAIIDFVRNYMVTTYNYTIDDAAKMISEYGFNEFLIENPELIKETGLEFWAGRIADNFQQ